jgi:DNA-binding CsgD family transcriptional regulator/tetratricopeptide (TPR) repeat protein
LSAAGAPFVGRDDELVLASRALLAGLDGRNGVVLVEGAPGVGKTRFTDEAIGRLDRSVRARRESARELEQRTPHTLIARALGGDAAVDAIHRDARDAVGILIDLLEDECASGPMVLVLDDLHAADTASQRDLWVLSRHAPDLPVALVATFRPQPGPVLENVLTRLVSEGAVAIQLEPLDEISDDTATALLEPMARASEATVELVQTAAVLGSSLRLIDLLTVTGARAIDMVDPVLGAIDAGLLVDGDDRLSFRSPALRDAVYESTDPAWRSALHLQAGRALAAAGAPAPTVAAQMAAAGTGGDEPLRWLRRAADDVRSTAPEVAIDLLHAALDATQDRATRDEIRATLVTPLARTGGIDDAIAIGNAVIDAGLTDHARLDALAGLALAHERRGRRDLAASSWLAASALSHIEPNRRASLLALAAHATLLGGAPDAAREQAERAEADAYALGDYEPLAIALTTLALCDAAEGWIHSAVARAEQAAALQGDAPISWLGASAVRHYLGLLLVDADQLERAVEVLGAGQRLASEAGSRSYVPYYHWELASCALLAGRLDDAVAEASAGLAIADETGTRLGVARAHAMLARVARHRDDAGGVERHLAAAEGETAELGHQLGAEHAAWVRAVMHEEAGDVGSAARVLNAAWDATARLRWFRSYRLVGPALARVAAAAGDHDLARSVAATVEEGARRSELPGARGAALRALGHATGSVELLLAAIGEYEHAPRPTEIATAREEAGLALIAADRRGDGSALVRDALREYAVLGASGDVARLTSKLRAFGLRPGRTASRPSSGWEALTRTERQVAALVAGGLSNRGVAEELYLSRYTVETHLKHVFAKLGVTSRVELARLAASSKLDS